MLVSENRLYVFDNLGALIQYPLHISTALFLLRGTIIVLVYHDHCFLIAGLLSTNILPSFVVSSYSPFFFC